MCYANISIIELLTYYHFSYNPLRGSSYIPTPKWIERKKATVNVRNTDESCFRWSVLAHKHEVEGWHHLHKHRVECYQPFKDDLDFTGVSEPTPLSEVSF